MGKRGGRWLADQLGALWEIEIENLDWNTMIVVVAVEIEEVDEGKHCVLQSKGRATINTDTHTHINTYMQTMLGVST